MTLFAYTTRGGKWGIDLIQLPDGRFEINEYKHGRSQGCAFLGDKNAEAAMEEFNRRIDDAAHYDGIFYTTQVNSLKDGGE